MLRSCLLAGIVSILTATSAFCGTSATLDVQVDHPGTKIPPTFAGLMTEEINHSYDGGLFAELIQNRTFQDPGERHDDQLGDLPAHWSLLRQSGSAKLTLETSQPVTPALPKSLRLDLTGGAAGVANDGYWGIPVRPNTRYTASFYARGGGNFAGAVTASIVTDDGKNVAEATSSPVGPSWHKYTVTLTTAADAPTTAKAKFVLSASGTGSVTFSLVSLFPPTYEDVPNGLRADLMQLMADMHPAFIRLPGGNYLEGDTFKTRFDWKKMIGPAEDRPGHMSCWGYRSCDGFGLPQYLLWCKQLKAEPVLALFAGYTLNHDHVNSGPEMQPYVDEALEEIEYVTGPADSGWGKQRAADGLPDAFPLQYVEIGNEDWFDRSGSYDGRFTQMFDAIRKKYPQLKIIATAPVKSRKPDFYDDHYYRSAVDMSEDNGHYDPGDKGPHRYAGGHYDGTFDRTSGPKIFVGEWATTEGSPTPTLRAALADAAWLMGLERDSDLVQMECYAPLLANVNRHPQGWQWKTNLIGYDAMNAFGSPSYYAQAMLAQNRGDRVLPVKLTVSKETPATQPPAPHGAVGVGTWHTDSQFKDIVVTTPDGKPLLSNPASQLDKWQFTGEKWRVQDGAVEPSQPDSETWASFGDPAWTDYNLQLKARKNGGKEGFLILFRVQDQDNFDWWNVGGWGNTKTQVQTHYDGGDSQIGRPSDFRVKPGRWYDLRVEVRGHHVRCFADGKLISEADDQPRRQRTTLFASATYATAPHEVVVKVVNMASEPATVTLNLRGAAAVKAGGKAIVLTGSPNDVNTIDQPKKVAPTEEQLNNAGTSFTRTFSPNSLTLLRIPAAAGQ